MGKKYFEDLYDGEHLNCQPVLMTKEAIIEFGKQFDPQPFHIDENAAKKSSSKPDRGFASIKYKVSNQCNDPVIEYGYRYLLACKSFRKI